MPLRNVSTISQIKIRSFYPAITVSEAIYSFRLLEALRSGQAATIAPFLKKEATRAGPVKELTSPLHLAVRCAEFNTIHMILQEKDVDVNLIEAQNGNTPLHLAAMIGRSDVVQLLLSVPNIDDTIRNTEGCDPSEVSKTPEIAQIFQVSRAELNFAFLELLESWEKETPGSTEQLKKFLNQGRIGAVDLNAKSRSSGTTLLHEAVRRKDAASIQLAVRKGADVFVRNKRGKRVLETTKDEKIKALLQQLSNADAAMVANSTLPGLPPIFRGYLGKWTNFAGGYKTRWFVLENGILSYYHTQEEEGKQSRGSTNLRFAKIRADSKDKYRFEVIADPPSGNSLKSSSKLFLRGSHPVERARWVQILQQSIDFFDIERTPSRAESIRSVKTGGAATPSFHDLASTTSLTNSHGTAPSMAPFSVPSRSTTPFRTMTSTAAPTIQSSSASSVKHSGASARPTSVKLGERGRTASLMTSDSRAPSDEIDYAINEESEHDSSKIPHEKDIALVSNYLSTNLVLSQQLAQSANGSTFTADVQAALQEALQTTSSLLLQYQDIVGRREKYLVRRYEQEIQAKHLWEENIRMLAEQHAEMELQLHEAAEDNARKRRALREVREMYGSTPSALTSPGLMSPPAAIGKSSGGVDMMGIVGGGLAANQNPSTIAGQMSERTSTIQARRGDPVPTLDAASLRLDATKTGIPLAVSRDTMSPFIATEQDGTDDADDEFFDAIESGNLPGLKIADDDEEQPPIQSHTIESSASTAGKTSAPATDKGKLEELGVEPYQRLREVMPIGKDDRPSVSLWSILKNNIGKDLTKISFPVSLNEPTSMLQRMGEDMTYAHLLDTAVRQKESTLRIAFVAAFACSNYVTTLGRVAKPFNPMLGETFEFVSLKGSKYRYQSEQVSHHPPISACIAESLSQDGTTSNGAWEYTGCVSAQSKFLGRSFEVRPTGLAHVKLTVNGVVEHYSFKKVTTSISGFVTGSPTIDHYGDMVIKCHTTGDECTMTFKPRGWRANTAHELKGTVQSGKGNSQAWEIAGRWSSQIVARRVNSKVASNLDPDGNVDSLSTDPSANPTITPSEMVLLWKYLEQPLEAFNLTPYAVLLNDLPKGLHDWLPPTDCRLRPDLRLFETGRYEEADVMKRNLEEFQRGSRKKREMGEMPQHKPKFFTKIIDADTQADYWQPNRMAAASTPEYWVRRPQRQWEILEKIFGDYTA
ncbi:hypothetical protein CBS101457_005718 [Exobasidium rhododendri]|nr:hypothetical protein CBS101457_005718 [Exobasidium rhododendri]